MIRHIEIKNLKEALAVNPRYKTEAKSIAERLLALSDLYKVYIPSKMSIEIYEKLYLSLIFSLDKKKSINAAKQRYENYKHILKQSYNNILGGIDSYTIIGLSGIGKSSAVNRAISIISNNNVVELTAPYKTIIIPFLSVQCPFDCSVKGLLIEILRCIDEQIDSDYYVATTRKRVTTDVLLSIVSPIAINHIGVLIVDEIQNIVHSRNGRNLVGALTQIINSSGISICMVGTPDCKPFFEQAMHLARRSVGLSYLALEYNAHFEFVCKILFKYQYTQNKIELTENLTYWLYEHSKGLISVVVHLIHDAQEIAILNNSETITLKVLNEAYQKRLTFLHPYLDQLTKKLRKNKTKIKEENEKEIKKTTISISISEITKRAKKEKIDVIPLLREHYKVIEIKVGEKR